MDSTRLTTEEFIKRARLKHGSKFDYSLVEYTRILAKVIIVCPIHGQFTQRASSHLEGHGCSLCKKPTNIDDLESFVAKAVAKHGDTYDYSKVNYASSVTKVTIICKKHDTFEQTPNAHLTGAGCQVCAIDRRTSSMDNFIEKAIKVHKHRFDYSKVRYTTTATKVKIGCKIHGYFMQSPNKHLFGNGCPICRVSKGEAKIVEYLCTNKIEHRTEKSFKDCVNTVTGNLLRYDFYLPNHNILIEYDGTQHYEPFSFGSDKSAAAKIKNFEAVKHRDKLKDDYAASKNIRLIRIPYTEINNITSILDCALLS